MTDSKVTHIVSRGWVSANGKEFDQNLWVVFKCIFDEVLKIRNFVIVFSGLKHEAEGFAKKANG